MKKRVLIVFDGRFWHVRRVASVCDNDISNEMVYHCDAPISSQHVSAMAAMESAQLYLAGKRRVQRKKLRKGIQ